MAPRVKMLTRAIEIVLVAVLLSRGVGLAVASDTIRFNIPAEEAPAAIRDFASQANVQIIVAGESVNGKRLHAVVGELSTEQALRILLAGSGHAPLAPEKCTANLLILVTPHPDELLEKLRREQHRVFSRCRTGEGAIRHFLETDRPVRVWYNWEYSAGDISPYGVLALADVPEEIGGCATVVAGTNSRLTYGALRSIDTEIIAVDLSRMQGVNMGQLADYIAMISLAEIDLDERVANVPTILRLFDASGDAPTEGMSLWDKALLRALYAAPETDVMWLSQVKFRAVDIIAPP